MGDAGGAGRPRRFTLARRVEEPERRDCADDHDSRRLECGRRRGDRAECGDDHLGARERQPRDRCGRLGRWTAVQDQVARDPVEAPEAHEDHERAGGCCQLRVVELATISCRARDDGDLRRCPTMRERDAGERRHRRQRRQPRDDFVRHAGSRERGGFLATAAEHKRVAALETHDSEPASGLRGRARRLPVVASARPVRPARRRKPWQRAPGATSLS